MKLKHTKRIVMSGATLLPVCLVLSVGGCSTEEAKPTGEAAQSTVSTGRSSSGIAAWRTIPQTASDVSLPGNEELVKSRRGYITLDSPDVYAETLLFPNGSIFYKRDRGLSSVPDTKDDASRLARIEAYLKTSRDKNPILRDVGAFRLTHPSAGGTGESPLTYASAESSTAYCVAFYKSVDRASAALAKSAIGVFCYPRKEGGTLNNRVDEVATLAESLRFDGGELAQADSLKGITQQVHAYWSSQDQKPPEVTLSKAEYSDSELFISGKATDESKIGFIKVNGERLGDADFAKVMAADGSFSLYAKSKRPVGSPSITVGDMAGNATVITQAKHPFAQVGSVSTGGGAVTLSAQPAHGKAYLLLAGVGDYQDSVFPKLISPVNDIQKVEDALMRVTGVPAEQVVMLKNPTKNEFMKAILDIRSKFQYGDQFMVYYAGHGIIFDETGDGYWSFNDTTKAPASWLSNREMRNIMAGFSDGGTLLVADSCFSGQFINGRYVSDASAVSYKDSIKAKLAMTSAGRTPVPDTTAGAMNSAFALAFVKSLQEWAAKANAKGEPDIPGLFVYQATLFTLRGGHQKEPQYGNFTDDAEKAADGKVPDFMVPVK